MTYTPIQGQCPVCHQDSANTAFHAGAASRDAEIAELRKQVTLLRVAIHKAVGTCFNKQSYERCMADPTYFINVVLAATEPKP